MFPAGLIGREVVQLKLLDGRKGMSNTLTRKLKQSSFVLSLQREKPGGQQLRIKNVPDVGLKSCSIERLPLFNLCRQRVKKLSIVSRHAIFLFHCVFLLTNDQFRLCFGVQFYETFVQVFWVW